MPRMDLEIWSDNVPFAPYAENVLKRLEYLFDIDIEYEWNSKIKNRRYLVISTNHHVFEVKRECMRLEKQKGIRIADIDILLYHETPGRCWKEYIGRLHPSFIKWRIKNYFKGIKNHFRGRYS